MSAIGLGMKTIWITLRAADYTAQAFNSTIKNTEKLKNKEKELGKENKSLANSTLAWFKAGLMTATLGVTLAGAIWNLASSSRAGAGDFARLNQQMFLTRQAFADTFYEALKATGILSAIQTVLNILQNNKALQYITIGFLGFLTILTLTLGVIRLFKAALALKITQMGIGTAVTKVYTTAVHGLKTAFSGLGGAMGIVMGSLTVFMLLGQAIGSQAAAIVAACTAIAAAILAIFYAETLAAHGTNLPMAMKALAVGAGIGAAVLSMQSFRTGTSALREDGPVIAHRGEVIYNPRTNMPTQVGNNLGNINTPKVSHNSVSIYVDNLNTKADIDDIDSKLSKIFYKKFKNSM